MAATAIARTQLSHVPLVDPAGVAADIVNGNIIPNSGGTIFRIKNTAAAPGTITFNDVTIVEDFTITHAAYTIPLTSTQWLGKHDVQNFGANITMLGSAITLLITAFEP
jgi:hypothetical protein